MHIFRRLSQVGADNLEGSYTRGLLSVVNLVALAIPLLINVLLLPIALISNFTIPLLILNSVFYPLTLLFNYLGKYLLAQHYLVILLMFTIGNIVVVRGIGSGVLFLTIPLILLIVIFFFKSRTLYTYLGILLAFLFLIFLLSNWYSPLAPFNKTTHTFAFPILLIISLLLTVLIINFFMQVTQQYQNELEELNVLKAKLLSIIGHDMRAPINSLQGILRLLNEKHLSREEFYALTHKLQASTEQVSNTLNNLLFWANAQFGGFVHQPKVYDISLIADEQLGLYASMAQEKHISLHNDIPAETLAFFDVDQVRLILRNLVHNALKYTQEGGSIHLKCEAKQSGLQVMVSDTGVGIPPATLDKLRSNLRITSESGTKGESGTGLGLQVSKELIRHMGGTLQIDSVEHAGSTFSFILPNAEPFQTKKSDPAKSELQH